MYAGTLCSKKKKKLMCTYVCKKLSYFRTCFRAVLQLAGKAGELACSRQGFDSLCLLSSEIIKIEDWIAGKQLRACLQRRPFRVA
jgi:hypothetical protein